MVKKARRFKLIDKKQMKSVRNDDDDDDEEEEENDDNDETKNSWWLEKTAIFGDSPWALGSSVLMLLFSYWIATYCNPDIHFQLIDLRKLMYNDKMKEAKIYDITGKRSDDWISQEMLNDYQRDGVIAIRGLLNSSLLDQLDLSSQEFVDQKIKSKARIKGSQFFQVEMNVAFSNPAFLNVALFSNIPSVASQLLQLPSSKSTTLRMLRDIFLVKDDDQFICGWHTDDTGFWPATADSPGINAWIALDDMPILGGGGFALAVGSHRAPWRFEAHQTTGSTLTLPKHGFRDVADMFANRTGSGTCNIKTSAPHLHQRMEASKRIYQVRKGDVIFHDRWLFHRTEPFHMKYAKANNNQHLTRLYRRYSIRYGPGTAQIPPGYGLELSVLSNPDNAGRTADDISRIDGPWYPQCWPSIDGREMEQLSLLVNEKIPAAEILRKVRRKEMKPYLMKRTKS
jgi:Phytanoyl-CoA dioxygenase (PhyH)